MGALKRLAFFLFFFPLSPAFGQDATSINTDRPDQTDAVYTLPKSAFQLETGVRYGDASGNYFLHNTLLRYGLFSSTELRVGFDYGKAYGTTGVMPVEVSIKQRLLEQKGAFPAITAIGNMGLPFLATGAFRPDKVPAELLLAFENELSDHFSVACNAGPLLDGESSRLHWLVTGNIGFSPGDELSFFLEYFSTFAPSDKPDHNVDAGILWLLTNNLQLDLAAGTSIFRSTGANRFLTLGLSFRFGG